MNNNTTYDPNTPRTRRQYKNLSKRNFVIEKDVLMKYMIKRGDDLKKIAERFNVSVSKVRQAAARARAVGANDRLVVGKIISVRTGTSNALRFYRKITSRAGISRRVSIRCKELSRVEILKQIKRMTGQGGNAVAYEESRKLIVPPFAGRRSSKIIETEPVQKRLKDLGRDELCTWARKVATSMQKVKNEDLFKYKKIKHWGTKTEIDLRNNLNARAKNRLQRRRKKERRTRLSQYVKQREFKNAQNKEYTKHA